MDAFNLFFGADLALQADGTLVPYNFYADDQYWTTSSDATGPGVFITSSLGKVLDVNNEQAKAHQPVGPWVRKGSGTANQRWDLSDPSVVISKVDDHHGTVYVLVATATNTVAIDNRATASPANLIKKVDKPATVALTFVNNSGGDAIITWENTKVAPKPVWKIANGATVVIPSPLGFEFVARDPSGKELKPTPLFATATATIVLQSNSYYNSLVGDWWGIYAPNVYQEVFRISLQPDGTLQGLKLVGDNNVPTGQVSFKIHPDFSVQIQVAGLGFTNSSWANATFVNHNDPNLFDINYSGILTYHRLPPATAEFNNLVGEWTAFYGGIAERVRITVVDHILTAIKLIGDNNVPAGQVSFEIETNWNGRIHCASAGFTNPYWLAASLAITDANHFNVSYTGGAPLQFTRA